MRPYTQQDADDLNAQLTSVLAPIGGSSRVSLSTLGGDNRASLMILICLDQRGTWSNGIMENSRYRRFAMHSDAFSANGALETITGSRCLKFRKRQIVAVGHAARLLKAWIEAAIAQPVT